MKILHTVSGMNLDAGGPPQSIYNLVKGTINRGVDTKILTLNLDKKFKSIAEEDFIIKCGSAVVNNFGYSANFKKILFRQSEIDLIHIHGLWQYTSHVAMNYSVMKGIRSVISPRGMLEPWALNNRKLLKEIALKIYQRKDLSDATCIHATSKIEADNIRSLGFINNIALVANGIDLSIFIPTETTNIKEKSTVLFLSRIHPKKGIELLIDAYYKLEPSLRRGWQVKIAGNGDAKYIKTIMKRIKQRGLDKEIKIIGPQFGLEKLKTLQEADLFVLPSYSENFGMVVAEALACGIPVITTKGTPWEELNIYNAGWWIDHDKDSVAKALRKAMTLDDNTLKTMGANGRNLIEKKYSLEIITSKMIDLYNWILKGGNKPDFIYTN